MAAAYVSHDTGAASRSVTVAAGTDRLLVAIALSTASTGARSATYGGVAMNVATTANGWVQIFYMLAPPVGSATLAVTGSNISTVVAAHYTGIVSFQGGQQATGVPSASFSPTGPGLVAFGMVASSTSHTPVASTNERVDSGGDYYADRIVAAGGSVTVGVSSATDPDYAGAIFLEGVSGSGTPSAPAPASSGSATVEVAASGAAAAPAPTASGSGGPPEVNVSGAVTALQPSASGSAERIAIQCDHPRPKLDLPGYTPTRLAWSVPAYIPLSSLADLGRAVREGFQGIFNELMKLAQRRNLVPLVEDLQAREGQVIVGVGDGQTITLPPAGPGAGEITVVLTDVVNPVTVVNPDGSTLVLDQPGRYDLGTTDGEDAWRGDPGVSSAGTPSGVGYVVDAAHASVPNARVATAATEITPVTSTPGVITWVLNTASVAFSKLANLTGLSVLGRAANSSGVMAAITASGAGQYLRSNAAGTSLEFADPASTSVVNTSGQLQRAAVTGAVAIAQNANASLFAGIRANGSATADRTNLNLVNDATTSIEWSIIDDAANDELEIRGQYVGSTTNINLTSLSGDQNVVDISTLRCGGSVTIETVSADYSIDGFTAKTDGFWFWLIDRRNSGSTVGQLLEDISATTTSIRNAHEIATVIPYAGRALLYYFNGRWRAVSAPDVYLRSANTFTATNTFTSNIVFDAQVEFSSTITPSAISSNQNDYNPTGWSTANIVRLSTNDASTRDITGASAGASGELKWLVNTGPGTIRLQHEHASSSGVNRFLLASGTTFNMSVNGVVGILYDASSSRWRPTSHFGS